jgi:hypothetical protein
MTIGFAFTYLTQDTAAFLLAADCRYSTPTAATDTGIKTYSLDRTTGAVVAGNALSVASAIELTRGIADDHNRLDPEKPINFYSTVRLFSFFLDKIEQKSPWSQGCEVAVAGFLTNGMPALAKVITGPTKRAEVHFYSHQFTGSLFLFVGQRDGKEQIFSSVAQALKEGGQHWMQRAIGTIAYLCEHEGERTIGGAPAVAVCTSNGVMHWPIVTIGKRRYLRGFDVTPMTLSANGVQSLDIRYDQAWHVEVDRERLNLPVRRDEGFASVSRYVDDWVPSHDAFNWKIEPEALKVSPDFTSVPQYIGIARAGEFTWIECEAS